MLKEFLHDICQLVQMDSNQYEDYLSFCFTIATTMFASGISVLTLTVAFIANKRDALKTLTSNAQQSGISLSLAKQIDAAQRFIKNMKDITNQAIYAIGISGCSTLLYCIFKSTNPTVFVHILGLSVLIAVLLVCVCLYKLCIWYYKK